MASYTIELRRICDIFGRDEVENWFKDYNLTDYLTEKQIKQIELNKVWSKDRLAKKIVDHYYMREIRTRNTRTFQTLRKSLYARDYGT